MLIGKNKRKMGKKALCLIFAFLLSINSFAAVVSDNDGSAFITKAEFDSLKNNFQNQLNNYNTNIDSKIDNAISSYLSGIKQERVSKVNTAFVLDGDNDAKIIFVGKTNNFNNMSNELYTKDSIFEIFAGTYQTIAYYIQDTYDTFCFQSSYEQGNANNYLLVLDKNKGTVLSTKKNATMNASRVYVAYTTTHAQNGIFWDSITQTLDTPTAITDQNNAFIDATDAQGYGIRRLNSDTVYKNILQEKCWSANGGQSKGFGYNTTTGEYTFQRLYSTDLESKVLTDVTKTCDVAISGTDVKPNLHWPTGSDYNIHTTDKEWGSKDLITSYNTSRVDYTYTYKLKNAGGQIGTMELARQITPDVKGYGLKWVFSDKSLSNVYYDGVFSDWGKKYSYAGGVPICHAKKKGKIKLSLKCSAGSMPMAFTTSQNTIFPTGTDARFRKFKSKRSTETTYVERTTPVNFAANVTYDFEVELEENENLFLVVNMTTLNDTLTIHQIGDAYITEEV